MAERFRASSFATVVSQLRETSTILRIARPRSEDQWDELARKALNDADQNFKELPLSVVLRSQWERLLQRMNEKADSGEISILIREMGNNLLVELTTAYFLMIPADRRFAYEQPYPVFGPEVHKAFPEARLDIAAASRCYALDEWTACVMHLMRALEHGLRWLGNKVALTPEEMEGKNWKNVIDGIEKKIEAMEQLPKSQEKTERLRFFSGAASQFRWFKDEFRNDAAHGHVFFDEKTGAPIFLHVSDFYRIIATEAVKEVQE
jgi:hypothetical protein